ncbi:MAG: hypothetical protein ACK5JL_06005 [Candidatus Kapaibacterium sp.]
MQSKAGGGSEIFCDLIVVEIIDGQNPEEALRLNPPVILRKNLTTSSWQTSILARQLQNARRYAWRVIAKVNKEDTPALDKQKIVSASEIWTFVYRDPVLATGDRDSTGTGNPNTLFDQSGSMVNEGNDAHQSSQDEPSPRGVIGVNGTAKFLAVSENRRGNLSQAPPVFQRMQIDPTITLLGIPIGLNLLLSSEQNVKKSDLSRGVFGTQNVRKGLNLVLQQRVTDAIIDMERSRDSASVDTLRQFAAMDSAAIEAKISSLRELQKIELGENMESLQEYKLSTPEQETLSMFPAFGFGKVTPQFGSLLFNNTTINGALLEYNPGNFYTGAAVGKIQRETDISSLPETILNADTTLFKNPLLNSIEFHRNIYSWRVGYGRRNGNIIALTGVYSDDDAQSKVFQSIINRPTVSIATKQIVTKDSLGNDVIVEQPDTTVQQNVLVSPQRNIAVGASSHLAFESISTTLDGEFTVSYLQDKTNYGLLSRTLNRPSTMRRLFVNDSAIIDYNFALKGVCNLSPSSNLSAAVRYIGAGFRSVGIVGLRTDVLRADGFLVHTFADRQIRLRSSCAYEKAGYRDSVNESEILNVRGGVDIRLNHLPMLSIDFNMNQQELVTNKNDVARIDSLMNQIQQISASVTDIHAINHMRWSYFASFAYQRGLSTGKSDNSGDSVGVFEARSCVVNNRLSLSSLITLSLTLSGNSTINYPIVRTGSLDTAKSFHKKELNENASIDFSSILHMLDVWETIVGTSLVYNAATTGPAIYGAYVTSRLNINENFALDFRFDYRQASDNSQSAAQSDPKSLFPIERTAKLITYFKW